MRIGLVSYRCENGNTLFNLTQMEKAMKNAEGKTDLLCFGEAFLQGFDALSWQYETDRHIAISQDSLIMDRLKQMSVRYHTALLFGYIEREEETLYSSCAVISEGKIIHNCRRISKGWKEHSRTDDHYREGTTTGEFAFMGKKIMPALCGDLWEYPERFQTDHLLIWPVYVDFTVEEWEEGELEEYAAQAAKVSPDTLMINPLDASPVNHGGSFRFAGGKVAERIPFDTEGILITEII